MDTNETFEAECISKKKDLTEGKIYQVKQSKYTNMYELVDDTGHVDTYFKERFKIIEKPAMEVGEIKFYENGDVKYPISKEEYEKGMEGDKMEDKTIKVRCIDNRDSEVLTLGKQYNVNRQNEDYFEIYLEDNKMGYFPKQLFEKVEDVLMVECVWSDGTVTGNIKYPVIAEYKETYLIKNDLGEEKEYYKTDFKPVEPQKEVKEYSVMELLDFPTGTEFQNIESKCYVKIVEIEGIKTVKAINKENSSNVWNKEAVAPINEAWKRIKFIKVEEPKTVTTAEAFKALDEFKTIISTATANKYRKHLTGNYIMIYLTSNDKYVQREIMETRELEGQWIIHA